MGVRIAEQALFDESWAGITMVLKANRLCHAFCKSLRNIDFEIIGVFLCPDSLLSSCLAAAFFTTRTHFEREIVLSTFGITHNGFIAPIQTLAFGVLEPFLWAHNTFTIP